MALNFQPPFLRFLSHPPFPRFLSHPHHHHYKNTLLLLLQNNLEPSSSSSLSFCDSSSIRVSVQASTSSAQNDVADGEGEDESERESEDSVLDDESISRVASLNDASEVLQLIVENGGNNGGGVVSCADCCKIINAALYSNNSDLALSIFAAMRSSSFDQVLKENGGFVARWKWSRPDLNTYTTLVIGLAASLRVSNALKMLEEICEVGLSSGEEVPFGKIIRCPTCMIAVAVAQPQQGIQVVCCGKCRYKYELVSGDIVNIESEEIRISSCRTQHGCSSLEKVAGIPSINKANNSLGYTFCSDPNPFWSCSYTQICYGDS